MMQWRAPYFPYEQNQNFHEMGQFPFHQQPNSFPYQAQNQQPQQSQQQPQQPVSPFEYFAKPQQQVPWETFNSSIHGPNPKPWGQQPKGIISYFQDKDGQVDIDKMLHTVGQMATTYQQVSPLVKQLGTFVKGFK